MKVSETVAYKANNQELNASLFIPFVNRIWPDDYTMVKTQWALSKALNITAYEDNRRVGCVRILSDGYYFGTLTALLVLPEYQKHGIGRRLLSLAKDKTSMMLYLGYNKQ